jgi:DNA-binding response OmpR family regulator
MPKRVLIIDDEDDVRKYLVTVLKRYGYETLTASDGVEGLAIAKRERPDLVSLDLMMPNQSGTDFYRNLCKDKKISATPIIVVSGLSGRHLSVKNPVAVFDKPIDPLAFIEAVMKAIGPAA